MNRLAVALEHHRMVARDMQGRFVLGPRLGELAARVPSDLPLLVISGEVTVTVGSGSYDFAVTAANEDLGAILDSIDDDEPPTELYTLNVHEARMLAHAVLNVVQADARVGCVSDEAEIAASEAYAQGVGERPFSQRMRAAITAALPHLESATEENLSRLRDTPAGRALMAEALGKVLAVHTPKDNGRVSPCCSCEQWIESSDDEEDEDDDALDE